MLARRRRRWANITQYWVNISLCWVICWFVGLTMVQHLISIDAAYHVCWRWEMSTSFFIHLMSQWHDEFKGRISDMFSFLCSIDFKHLSGVKCFVWNKIRRIGFYSTSGTSSNISQCSNVWPLLALLVRRTAWVCWWLTAHIHVLDQAFEECQQLHNCKLRKLRKWPSVLENNVLWKIRPSSVQTQRQSKMMLISISAVTLVWIWR